MIIKTDWQWRRATSTRQLQLGQAVLVELRDAGLPRARGKAMVTKIMANEVLVRRHGAGPDYFMTVPVTDILVLS